MQVLHLSQSTVSQHVRLLERRVGRPCAAAGRRRPTTTPVCSPARAAFLTGLNPHRAGFASVANSDPGFPGYTMEIAEGVPTLAAILREAGYATFAVGKWHLARDALMHDAAARRSWPCQQGFERHYGVLEGLTNLHHPHRLIADNSPVDIDEYPRGYYLPDDITDRAISMIKALRASDASAADGTRQSAGRRRRGLHLGLQRNRRRQPRGRLGPVLMLLGMAPFQGIDVGIDRRSPASWPLYERHGPFRYRATLESVTYQPGDPAPYSPEAVLRATIDAAHAFE